MKGSKIPAFWQAVLVVVVAYLVFDNAFPPVTPRALLVQYMIVTVIGVLLYFSFDDARWNEFKGPVLAVLRDDDKALVRWAFLIAIPLIVAYTTYGMVKPSVEAPVELRQVHPAPPSILRVFNKTYDLSTLENPVRTAVLTRMRSDPEDGWERYRQAVTGGRDLYYRNCFYCHGDLLDGRGHFAHGFNPLPINFQDVGTIAQLQEAFLFWRITTGGPGLPKEGTPWNSAMPVWHEMLDEEQVWNVIAFVYDYVGQVPRMWDPEMSKTVTGMKDEILRRRAGMRGQELYRFRCAVCHGETGMGDGPGADFMYPRPRDFSLALFKYKTSPGTLLPRDQDLFDTVKSGLPGTAMPAWGSLLSDQQIRSLIPVIKGFDITAAWAPEDADDEAFDEDGHYLGKDLREVTEVEPLDGQIAYSEASIAQGKKAFDDACNQCHGPDGRGNITSGKKLQDDWGARIWPRDLTKPWTWRVTEAGAGTQHEQEQTIRNIYTRLSIGIPGTPMPAHRAVEEGNEDPVSLEDRWHIANYVYSLREKTLPPGDAAVVEARKVEGKVPSSPDDERWGQAPAVTLDLVPNVIKEERLFTPLNDAVTVRALYDARDIVFLLEVDDRTESRPGIDYFTDLQDETKAMHSDALAIEFPKEGAYVAAPVVEKPLYRHGDAKHPTTIWYWNAGSIQPEVAARSMLFDATGPDRKLAPRGDDRSLVADGEWQDGRWRILMKRPRHGEANGDIAIDEGKFIPIAFANWDGSNGEAGSQHTLTTWYWLLLPPEPDVVRTYGLPLGIGLLVFVAGLGTVRGQRGKQG